MTEPKQSNYNYPYTDNEINLKELFGVLLEGKKVIILVASIFGVCSVFYALSLTDHYTSETTVIVASKQQSNISSAATGLASLAGVNMPGRTVDTGSVAVATIQSRTFLKHLISIEGEDILPSLMAAKSFDKQSRVLTFDTDIYNPQTKKWVRQEAKPTVLEAHKEFNRNIVNIEYDLSEGFMHISIEHISPIFAKEFLDLIIKEVNELTRQRELEQATQALDFLKTEMSKTSIIEIKSSINQVIKSQLEFQMMAKVREDFVLKTIEPPFVPEEKSSPTRLIMSLLGTILGTFLAAIWILFTHYSYGYFKVTASTEMNS